MNSYFKRTVSAAAALMLAVSTGITGFAQETGGIGAVTDAIFDNSSKLHYSLEKVARELDETGCSYEDLKPLYDPAGQPRIALGGMPEKFDLRNVNGKNYVSEVKLQDPWGTCWSFGCVAAAEISLATSLGYDYDDPNEDLAPFFDLSEKHFAWFASTPLVDTEGKYASQAGEGMTVRRTRDGTYVDYSTSSIEDIDTAKYDNGGYNQYGVSLFSSAIGPVLEEECPYGSVEDPHREKRHLKIRIVTFDETGFIRPGTSELSYEADIDYDKVDEVFAEKAAELGLEEISLEDAVAAQQDHFPEKAGEVYVLKDVGDYKGDWSVDESLRFGSWYEITEGNQLPEPSCFDEDYNYCHNPYADAAIKSELLKGRGVSIAFKADQSMPGVPSETCFMNFIDKNGEPTDDDSEAVIWAHYAYDESYDPDDPESVNKALAVDHIVCIVGYDDTFPKEYFYDPNGTIAGDGAWIVKNSWGSADNSDAYARSIWGNNGDGYFYLSYYDQSLATPTSFAFESDPEVMKTPKDVDMYDFMVTNYHISLSFDRDISFSNVFTADNNCAVRFVSVDTCDPECDVTYKVYLLDDDAKDPEDGELACTHSEHYTYAGFHRADPGTSIPLCKGDKYSVVVSIRSNDGSELVFTRDLNDNGLDHYTAIADAVYDSEGTPEEDRTAIFTEVRKGVVNKGESYICADGQWADWSDVIADLKELDTDLNNSGFEYDNFSIKSYPEIEYLTVLNYTTDGDKVYTPGDVLHGEVSIENNFGLDLTGHSCEIELTVGGKVIALGENNSEACFGDLKAGEKHMIPYTYTVTEEDAAAGKIVSEARLKMDGEYFDYASLIAGTLSYEVRTAPAADSSVPEPKPSDSNPATGAAAVSGILAAAAALMFAAKRKR